MSTIIIPPRSGSFLMPALDHAIVVDAMHPGVVSCSPSATLAEVARLMATNRVHCIAVVGIAVEPPGEKFVWKIISDFDLLAAGLDSESDQHAIDVVVRPMLTVEPRMPLREAAQLMLRHGVAHVVVVDPQTQRPVGILSTLDLAGILGWGEG